MWTKLVVVCTLIAMFLGNSMIQSNNREEITSNHTQLPSNGHLADSSFYQDVLKNLTHTVPHLRIEGAPSMSCKYTDISDKIQSAVHHAVKLKYQLSLHTTTEVNNEIRDCSLRSRQATCSPKLVPVLANNMLQVDTLLKHLFTLQTHVDVGNEETRICLNNCKAYYNWFDDVRMCSVSRLASWTGATCQTPPAFPNHFDVIKRERFRIMEAIRDQVQQIELFKNFGIALGGEVGRWKTYATAVTDLHGWWDAGTHIAQQDSIILGDWCAAIDVAMSGVVTAVCEPLAVTKVRGVGNTGVE